MNPIKNIKDRFTRERLTRLPVDGDLPKKVTERVVRQFVAHAEVPVDKVISTTEDRFLGASLTLDTLNDAEDRAVVVNDVYSQIEATVYAVYREVILALPDRVIGKGLIKYTGDNREGLLKKRAVKSFLKDVEDSLEAHCLLVDMGVKQPNTCFVLQDKFIGNVLPALHDEIVGNVRKHL